MKTYAVFIIFIVVFLCNEVKCKNNETLNEALIINKFKEFKNVTSQNLLVISPSKYCKCHHRTLYFNYKKEIEKENVNERVYKIILKNKEYFVGGIHKLSKNPYSKSSLTCVREPLNHNNVIRLFVNPDSNFFWYNKPNSTILHDFNKYQRYNHIIKLNQIAYKDLLYNNYYSFKMKFPDDYTYMVETYTSKQMSQFKKNFQNYTISKDNLWLVKPKGSSRGRGIYFLEDANLISKNEIVTKYISNPLLIEKKKFDLRIYILVTGHNPLKIYIYEDCFARLSTEEFNIDLNDLNNTFKHLTNVSINKKNNSTENYNPETYIWPISKVKIYLKSKYNIDFGGIWEKIEDLIIKSLITMNHIELEKEKEFNLSSNNIFELYGVDVMIDDNLKPWLIEINLSPDLSMHGEYQRELKSKLINDLLNIIGIVPYSHINGLAMEGECDYKDSVDEAVQQSICEFTRPLGGYKRIFPKSDNIEYYKKFFKIVSQNNQVLWDSLQLNDLE